MKRAAKIALVAISVAGFAGSMNAQRRTPVTRPKPAVVTTNTVTTPAATLSDAQRVSNQVMNVTKFLYILGGVAKGIEDIDKDTKANRNALDLNAANKRKVIQGIRDLRAGLAALEVDFRTKPLLRKYLLKIDGISALTGQSEDLATAGKFSDAGRPLVMVVEKLADTLVAMP